jgi:outer membrane protein OmpA-like peptidoglycan-associated protein
MKGVSQRTKLAFLNPAWILFWLAITPRSAAAEPGLPGSIGRTRMAFPLEGPGFVLEPARFSWGFGSFGENGFQSADFRISAEVSFLPWASLALGMPFYLDHCSDWAFGRGDLFCGAGLRWRPWADRSIYLALFPFMTIPTGQDGFSDDSLRRFSTDGLDYGVLGALSAIPWNSCLLGLNIGAYNPNQASGYGSHTNQVIYRALGIRQISSWLWLGAELSGEWFILNSLVPEISYIAGGSPLRLSLISRFKSGLLNLELSPGFYLTKRRVRRGDSLVYPRPLYTLPVGDMTWEIAGGISFGNSGLNAEIRRRPEVAGGVIAGRATYPDSTPAVVKVELPALGLATLSDSSGSFALAPVPPDSYMVFVSGQGIASMEPLKVLVMKGETTRLNLTVQRIKPSKVNVILRDIVTRKEIDGLVMVEGINSSGARTPNTFSVPKTASFPLMPGAYVITGKADGYFAQSMPLTIADNHDVQIVIDLIPQGFILEFPGVLFEFGSARIKKDAYPVLDSIASVVRTVFAANPNLKIEVGGYTDNVGSLKANMRLSEERAKAVANFLIENYGLNPDRVLYKGYGPAHPRAPNTTEEGRSANRRVEIRFLEVI